METLKGFYVSRSKHGECMYPIYSGKTAAQRFFHKQWIIVNVSDVKYDGETSFRDIEKEIIITKPGFYITENNDIIRIEKLDSDGRTAWGYSQKKTKKGKLKDDKIRFYWLTGETKTLENNIVGQEFS